MSDLSKTQIGPFTLPELCRTSHREFDNTPPSEVVPRLVTLVKELLTPIIQRWGSIWITSGYRSAKVNRAAQGSKDSAHLYGVAADIVFLGKLPATKPPNVDEVIDWLQRVQGLPIDQAIDEHSTTANWLHIGMLRPDHEDAPRHEFLRKLPGEPFKPHPKTKGAPLLLNVGQPRQMTLPTPTPKRP